mmetsp:Transcript_9346/g.38315  ORF Transcript_9346/g.38315 Transcript_9346/m.38315 type:complete len:205 (-) Transcript_9346:2564-3178(-)
MRRQRSLPLTVVEAERSRLQCAAARERLRRVPRQLRSRRPSQRRRASASLPPYPQCRQWVRQGARLETAAATDAAVCRKLAWSAALQTLAVRRQKRACCSTSGACDLRERTVRRSALLTLSMTLLAIWPLFQTMWPAKWRRCLTRSGNTARPPRLLCGFWIMSRLRRARAGRPPLAPKPSSATCCRPLRRRSRARQTSSPLQGS